MKPKPHQNFSIISPTAAKPRAAKPREGTWWQDAPREGFTRLAVCEVPRTSSAMPYESMGDAQARKVNQRKQAIQLDEVV